MDNNIASQFDSNELLDEEPENETFNFIESDEELMEEEKMDNLQNEIVTQGLEKAEEPKKEKKKKASKKSKVTKSKGIEIRLDENSSDLLEKLEQLVQECNNKSIGRKVVLDDVLRYIVENKVEPCRTECIFDIQKKTHSQDELDDI